MIRKIGLFFLSLWLLFLLTIIITVDIPIYLEDNWEFVGWEYLILNNILPILCIVCLIISTVSYLDFRFIIKGAPELSFKIEKVESIEYENLTFLTTYIVPLICFNFASIRYQIVWGILLLVIGMIYIRTDLFYKNPTLAILKFRIYKIDGVFADQSERKGKILITREILSVNDRVKYIKLDERIYYGFKVNI
ncbi:anti-phage protein KwaA [Ornithobacterium rhinotracheale]